MVNVDKMIDGFDMFPREFSITVVNVSQHLAEVWTKLFMPADDLATNHKKHFT